MYLSYHSPLVDSISCSFISSAPAQSAALQIGCPSVAELEIPLATLFTLYTLIPLPGLSWSTAPSTTSTHIFCCQQPTIMHVCRPQPPCPSPGPNITVQGLP